MKYFIETSKTIRMKNGSCEQSDVRAATNTEVQLFKSAPCDHSRQKLLVYDTCSYNYDIRHCAVCDDIIGFI